MAETDPRRSIDNALAILGAQRGGDPRAAAQGFAVAIEALRAARAAIDDLDGQLELLTAPERNAAREAARLRGELETERRRAAGLEQDLAMLRADRDVENAVHEQDRIRLRELEKRAKEFESVIMRDDDAFGRFMESALDEDELRDRRGKPPEPGKGRKR